MARRCRVPPGVYHALETPYRGQTGIGKKMIELLDFYEDVAVLVPTQLSITEASSSPGSMPPKANVKADEGGGAGGGPPPRARARG